MWEVLLFIVVSLCVFILHITEVSNSEHPRGSFLTASRGDQAVTIILTNMYDQHLIHQPWIHLPALFTQPQPCAAHPSGSRQCPQSGHLQVYILERTGTWVVKLFLPMNNIIQTRMLRNLLFLFHTLFVLFFQTTRKPRINSGKEQKGLSSQEHGLGLSRVGPGPGSGLPRSH